MSKRERRNIYPFDLANKIVVISFSSQFGKAPITNDTLNKALIMERIALTETQINALTDILFNFNYAKKTNLITETILGCYYPRQAIVFLDPSDRVISFIEICLECKHIETNLSRESVGVFCSGKYDLLKQYFISIGITYFDDDFQGNPEIETND